MMTDRTNRRWATVAETAQYLRLSVHETPLETWQPERRQAAHSRNRSAGQVANLLEGLTPDGRDRSGRKVSFVESDKAAFRPSSRRLSGN
jgi:hypothetical protein